MKKIFTLLTILLAAVQTNAQLVINEVDYDQPGADAAEFLELYNAGSSAVNLADYQVVLFNGNATSNLPYDTLNLPPQSLAAGDYFVIGMMGVSNVDLVNSGTIQNGSPDAIAIQEVATSALVDVVSYEGDCIAPWVEGTGVPLAQSDTLQSDSIAGKYLSIARFPDGADSNNNSADFNRVCATPGYANVNTNTGCASTTGIRKVESKFSFEVYPNPSKGIINVDLRNSNLKEVTVVVTDILGKELRRVDLGDFSSVYQFDIAQYHNGFYFVKVISAKGESAQRVMLVK
jgi:hypothetical protein